MNDMPLGRPAELLLVEDNYGDVLLTQEAFKSVGVAANITVAKDGDEALNILRKTGRCTDHVTPDLVIMDLNLPRRGGRDVLIEINKDDRLKAIPVIIFTSSGADTDVRDAYRLNANAYIVKPMRFEDLKSVVSAIEMFWLRTALLPENVAHEEAFVF